MADTDKTKMTPAVPAAGAHDHPAATPASGSLNKPAKAESPSEPEPERDAAGDEKVEPELVDHKIGDSTHSLTLEQVSTLKTVPVMGTATDANDVERIVVTNLDTGWSPAATEPDPDAVARAEKMSKALESKKDERLSVLSGS